MFKQYVDNEQFNLQINRFLNDYYQEDERANSDLKGIIPRLTDTESWFETWLEYAVMREEQQDFDLASVYYQAAEFYLAPSDPNKEKMYQKYRETFYKGFNDFDYESYQIPYENSYLPAIKLITPGADKTLLVFGGYDSYMEEMVKMMNFIRGIDYNIIVFDGPGQGTALKIRMPDDVWNRLTSLLATNEADKVNEMMEKMMASNIDLNWKVTKGMDNTGVKTPFTLIKKF